MNSLASHKSLFIICVLFSAHLSAKSHDISHKKTTDRFEIDYAFDALDPSNDYGKWHTLSIANYQKISDDLTVFYQAGSFGRKSGNALLASIGAYTDWSKSFYTYSQVTAGTNSEYLPLFRIDNDFNYKFGKLKNIVATIGISYINAHDDHSDRIVSAGFTYYGDMYNFSYRLFQNHSNPGNIISYSNSLSFGYGKEKWQWIYLTVSWGDQAYLSTLQAIGTEVRQDSVTVNLGYRKWTADTSGFYGNLGYSTLKDGYNKKNVKIGYFYEY